MFVLLWYPSTMHHHDGLEKANPDDTCQAENCSGPLFEESEEKKKYGHELTFSVDVGDCDIEESIRTDGSSSYSTPILSPTSSIASFKSCISTFDDFEAEVDSSSWEKDEPMDTEHQHHSLADDGIISLKHVDIEIECFDCKNNEDNLKNTVQDSPDVSQNRTFTVLEDLSRDPETEDGFDEEKNEAEPTPQLFLGNLVTDPYIWLPPDSEITDETSEDTIQERCKAMVMVMSDQFKPLVNKLLVSEGIPASTEESGDSWLDLVSSLSWEAAQLVKPNVYDGNAMDPELYVKIKCVACGSPSESQVIKGLVFEKNTAHRRMPSRLNRPRLLLFQGALGQKAIGLSSFDSMEQERDYLKAVIKMIDECHPDVVLVEKTVSRDIQELLLERGISLVYDMKLPRLKRISLCTDSPIISSADITIRPELKQCDNFHIAKFLEEHTNLGVGGKKRNKTLMFFEGCSRPLGCTILLKGDHSEKLKRLKHVAKSAIIAAHHLILETSFFLDAQKINYSSSDIPDTTHGISLSTKSNVHACSCKGEFILHKDTATGGDERRDVFSCEHAEHRSSFEGRGKVKVNGIIQFPWNGPISNILDSQGILILHSQQCTSKGIICEQNHLSRIMYYKRFDVSLGKFLHGILMDKEKLCSACGETPQAHSYSFTHHKGNLTVTVKKIPPENHLPGKLWMWACCTCGSQRSTTRVVISEGTEGLSFGRLLEIIFSNQSAYGKILFFGSGSYVAMFMYSSVDIYTACQSPKVLDFSSQTGKDALEREARDLLEEGEQLFSNIASLIARNDDPRMEVKVKQAKTMWREEKSVFEDCLSEILNGKRMHSLPFLNQLLLLELYIWDRRIDSLTSVDRAEEVDISSDADNSSFRTWKPFSDILAAYEDDLSGGSSQKFDFIQSYVPHHLPQGQRLVNEHKKWLHFPLGKQVGIISVCEEEISSIISYALGVAHEQHCSNSKSLLKRKSTDDVQRSENQDLAVGLRSDEVLTAGSLSADHAEIRVPIKGSNKSGYTVICLYAEQFRRLRGLFGLSEMEYVASVGRCKAWNAQGGKSKALFAKSLDGRLVIKQISRTELDSFLKFAPDYFKYVSSSLSSGSQTCLAKILGMYQVKLSRNGKETKVDLMVMENLLSGRSVSRVYDLKGAVFSRYVPDGDDPERVLLDQNFMHDMGAHPIYVTVKTKRLLQRAIWNDTCFLTSMDVMDYSLLIGVDEKRRELAFGIIDYLRQYTWDKKLERWAKSSWVVPKSELPTVISPKEYRKRFRKFMSRYFLTIPDG